MGDQHETEGQGTATQVLAEAATYKAQAIRLMRDMASLLADRTVPKALRDEVEDVRVALRKTWADLETDASGDEKPDEAPEPEEPEEDEEPSEEFRDHVRWASGMMESFGFAAILSEPFPAEHAARLQPPERFKVVRRQNDRLGPGIDVIWGVDEEGKTEMQAIRFDKTKFTADEAKKWLEDHDMKAIEFEKAEDTTAEADPPQATMAARLGGVKKLIASKNKLAIGMIKNMLNDATGDDTKALKALADAVDAEDWAKAARLLKDAGAMEEADMPTDESAKMREALQSIIGQLTSLLGESNGETTAETAAPEVEQAATAEALGESSEGIEVLSEGYAPDDGQGPLTLKVKLIEPGFGNAKDGHYYPKETLNRDAHVFSGAKMYESDHREGEKSTRTWVSTVRKVVGFSDTGAPLAEVVVHHPDFAQRLRNLSKAGMLDKMACSILATGNVKAGQAEGRTARIVESITDAQAVDWVTRAGAGGQAMELMEADAKPSVIQNAGGTGMAEEKQTVVEQPAPAQPEPVQEAAPTPVVLGKERVAEILKEAALPEPATVRLAERAYDTEEAVKEAIKAEVAYIKEVTGSGKVTDCGESAKPEPKAVRLEEKQKALDQIDARYGIRR